MRPDSIPPSDNTHHGIGHTARMRLVDQPATEDAEPTPHIDHDRWDAPTRATGRYAASPGARARGLSFTGLFNLTKRDLPAGVQR